MATHLDAALSAYVDESLSPEERAAAELHLAGCEPCRLELQELRSVRRLLAALPERAPSRSLLPRRSGLPGWLVPARWASSAAAVVFTFAFVVSSLPGTMQFSPTSGGQPAAAPAPPEAGRNAEDAAKLLASQAPTPAPNAAATRAESPDTYSAADRTTPVPRGSATAGRSEGLQEPAPAPSPLLWLGAAVAAGLTALGLQWRIARRRSA